MCPIVAAVHLEQSLQLDDLLYLVNVTEGHHNVNAMHAEQLPNDTELQSLLEKYKDCFPAELPAKLPPERNVYHTIPLKNEDPPPPRKSYRLSRPEVAELNTQVASLLEKGYIQPNNSPYGHPVLFVKRKNGNLRMCIDYKSLNQQTVKSRYPLPRIDDLFDRLQGAQVFSSIDLQSAYYQVRLKPDDVPKTAFTTPMGLYEFKVLCFGLTNDPGTFQNIMNDVLRDVIGKFVIVYLDDIVVYSKNKAEHLRHLKIVLQLLSGHQLYANLAKCKLVQPELHFLGHIVGVVLLQNGRPVAFDGKRLSPAEQNYSIGEQELLAVIHTLELWRYVAVGGELL